MYSIYKTKRKKRKIYVVFFLIIIIAGICYFGVKYQQYIFFWKYTYNKINQKLIEISKIDEIGKKKLKLQEIAEICNDYNSRNPVSMDTFLLSGKIHYQLGEIYLNKTYSEFIISGCTGCVSPQASAEFLNAIKDIKKGAALSRSNEINREYLLILAKSCFYSNYYNDKEIYNMISGVKDIESVPDVEDIRFLSIINILNKKEEYANDLLTRYGMVAESIKGRFFFASAHNLAGKYTDSIMDYKYILDNSSDSEIIKLANVNLGKIYFNQSLYNESLMHFTNALKMDNGDYSLKIWIGKNYSALGERIKARAIWQEVLASDQNNSEVRKLLGLM